MGTYKDVLKVIEKEVGVTESPSGSNKQKYGKEYGYNGAPWCVMFLWWAFKQANMSDLFYGGKKTASCGELKVYAKNNGQWVTSGYKPGDLVMMNFKGGTAPSHVGFLVSIEGDKYNTIEGNTSFDEAGSQSNGGAVAEKVRKKSVIVGAYRPNYPTLVVKKPQQTVTVTARLLEEGSTGSAVRILQTILNSLSSTKITVDGDFGPATKKALIKYQRANPSKCGTADGICGKKTWNSLLG